MKAFDNAIRPAPPHVPAALVYDYDHMTDPRLSPDAHAGCAAIAAEAPPIFFTPRYCGHWVVTGYADTSALALQPVRGRRAPGSLSHDARSTGSHPLPGTLDGGVLAEGPGVPGSQDT